MSRENKTGSQGETTFLLPVRVDDLLLADVLVTAVEDGVYYWAELAEYRHHVLNDTDPRDVRALLIERDPLHPAFGRHIVNLNTIEAGIRRIIDGQARVPGGLRDGLMRAVRENDAGDVDADLADVIVQAGLFGGVVYG